MADERRPPHSLNDPSADQIRNRQRGGEGAAAALGQDGGTEGNATMRQVWSEPGGEANSYRNALPGAGTKADGHGDLTAAETPETTKHLGDASLDSSDRDATADAIARATAVIGEEDDGERPGGSAGPSTGADKRRI